MNKLLAALIAAVFTLGSVAALAQPVTPEQRQQQLKAQEGQATNLPPATPEETKALKAAREKALMDKAEFAKMSPAEQEAFKKGRTAQRQMDLGEQGKLATELPPATPAETKSLQAAHEKALMDKADFAKMSPAEQAAFKKGRTAQRQMDLGEQEKAAAKGGGGG